VPTFLNFSRKNLLGVLLTTFLFVSLVVISLSVNKVREPVSRAANYSNNASSVGGLEVRLTSYPPDSAAGYPVTPSSAGCSSQSGSPLTIGQHYAGSYYYDYRAYVKFDTSSIPSNATITSAVLQFTLYSNDTNPSFTLQARDFNWNAPLSCSDWGGTTLGAGVVGSYPITSSSATGSSFPFNISLGAIKKSTFTSFMITSSREASQIRPASGVPEFISLQSPKLTAAYSVPTPPQPPQPSQPSSPTQKNTGSSSSSGSNWGSSSNKNLPNTLKKLNLKVSVPFLLGEMKVNIGIDQYSKELTLKHDETDYSVDTSDLGLPLNKIYTITFSGDKILKRKVQFNASSAETNVNAMELTLGDLNSDSAINNQDQLIFLDSISKQTSIGDINSDGATNSLDWSILLYNLGKVGD